ncbi:hypothetical protein Rsub_06478 [Raphidocelis subcapitata]|uniref:Flavin reductase like domain-containing protein n=1 Tax=Raphidocelis subcapitata TaxID=307507 RepID=A0A2V0P2W5_9CHLO|nr:hypothetical protein Rsub_06478 [Raphidocelis subcapitata]|eukprot:GBF94208.1 hypothetical protein Rsub_06478 [Raphidocelis subcapitata]
MISITHTNASSVWRQLSAPPQPRRGPPASPQQQPQRRAAGAPPRALSGVPDADAPPFTKLNTPVYSLSSSGPGGGSPTLNIVTYASPIAIKPARKYALGLYVGTLSWQNVRDTGRCVLQILQQSHSPLVPLLGKRSGRDVDKLREIEAMGFNVASAFGLPVLADHAGLMELRVASDFIPCGDHETVICDVVGWQDAKGPAAPLYTAYLRQTGFL